MAEEKNELDVYPDRHYPLKGIPQKAMPVIDVPHFKPVTPNQTNGLHFVLNGLRRWWKLALPIGLLLGSGAAAVVFWLFTPLYEATATLRIEARQPHIAFEGKNEDGNAVKSFVQTQVYLLRHPVVLRAMLADSKFKIASMPEIKAQPDPVKWLAKQISVKQEGDSELYDVSYLAPDPEAAAVVITALLNKYFKLRGEQDSSRTEHVKEALQAECNIRLAEIKKMREVVRDLAQQVNGKDPYMGKSDSTVVVNHPFAEQQNRLVNAEVEKAILEAKIKAYQSAPEQESPISDEMINIKNRLQDEVSRIKKENTDLRTQLTSLDSDSKRSTKDPSYTLISEQIKKNEQLLESFEMINNRVELHPEVLRIKTENTDLQIQLQSMDLISKRSTKDPAYTQISGQIKKNKQLLELLQGHLQKRFLYELRQSTTSNRNEQIAALQSELESKNITIAELRKVCSVQKDEVKQNSGDTLQLRFKEGELDRAEKVYAMISERIMALDTESGAPERVIVIQKAVTPSSPVEVFPYRNFALAGLLGFALPFGLALSLEKLIRRVADATNLENASQLPVIGEIAQLPTQRRNAKRKKTLLHTAGNVAQISSKRHGRSPRVASLMTLDLRMFQESIDTLRTTLMLAEDLRNMRIFAVTSATTHEGKTSVATQLAMSIARTKSKPVLLIDGDMRSPNLHEIFEVPLQPGFAKFLEGSTPLEEAIVPTSCPHLDLLPAGKLNGNPHQLLGNIEPAAIQQAIPAKYCYVIIDSPPVLSASEALVLATIADASLICALRDVSRVDQVKKAYQRLAVAGGNPLGLVLNGVPTKSYVYHYGDYGNTSR